MVADHTHKRMCKKIAQLTKVVHRLNVLNQTHNLELEKRDVMHREEVSYMVQDAQDKIQLSLDQVMELREVIKTKEHDIQDLMMERERMERRNSQTVERRTKEREEYKCTLHNVTTKLEQVTFNLENERRNHQLEQEKRMEDVQTLRRKVEDANACLTHTREEHREKEASFTSKMDQIQSQHRDEVEQMKRHCQQEMREMQYMHDREQSLQRDESSQQLEQMKKRIIQDHTLEMAKLQHVLNDMTSQNDELQVQQKELRSILITKEREIHDAQRRMDELEERLQEQTNGHNATVEEWKRQNHSLMQELDDAKSCLDITKKEMELVRRQSEDELEEARNKSHNVVQSLTSDLNHALAERDRYRSDLTQRTNDLRTMQTASKKMRNDAERRIQTLLSTIMDWKLCAVELRHMRDGIRKESHDATSMTIQMIMSLKQTLRQRIDAAVQKERKQLEQSHEEQLRMHHQESAHALQQKEKEWKELKMTLETTIATLEQTLLDVQHEMEGRLRMRLAEEKRICTAEYERRMQEQHVRLCAEQEERLKALHSSCEDRCQALRDELTQCQDDHRRAIQVQEEKFRTISHEKQAEFDAAAAREDDDGNQDDDDDDDGDDDDDNEASTVMWQLQLQQERERNDQLEAKISAIYDESRTVQQALEGQISELEDRRMELSHSKRNMENEMQLLTCTIHELKDDIQSKQDCIDALKLEAMNYKKDIENISMQEAESQSSLRDERRYFDKEMEEIRRRHEQTLQSVQEENNKKLQAEKLTWDLKRDEWEKATSDMILGEKKKWEKVTDDLISKEREREFHRSAIIENMRMEAEKKSIKMVQLKEEHAKLISRIQIEARALISNILFRVEYTKKLMRISMSKELTRVRSSFLLHVNDLQGTIYHLRNMEITPKETETIASLEKDLAESKAREEKLMNDLKYYRRELVNREDNFNSRFVGPGVSRNKVGILSAPRKSPANRKSRYQQSIDGKTNKVYHVYMCTGKVRGPKMPMKEKSYRMNHESLLLFREREKIDGGTLNDMTGREERIRQRREIIRRRYHDEKKETDDSTPSHGRKDHDHKPPKSEQQITESISHLQRRKKNQVDTIASFRIKADAAEGTRRVEHETFRQDYLAIIKREKENNQCPLSSWDSVNDEKDIVKCHEFIESMKCDYDEIIARKDKLIASFREKLIKQDDLYLECLRQHEAVVNDVREKSTTDLEVITALYNDELKSIDETFREDRRAMLASETNTLTSLSDKKRANANDHINAMYRRKEDKESNILQTHDAVATEFNGLRNKLRKQVTELERQLSVSKGMYSVSADQVAYKHREAETKNVESELKIKKLKKRTLHLKELVADELEKTQMYEKRQLKRNCSLEADCRRLELQYTNLLSKLHRFEVLEDQKFSAAVSMHKEEIDVISERIKNIRALIAEQFFIHRGRAEVRLDNDIDEDFQFSDEIFKKRIDARNSSTENETEEEKRESDSWSQIESIFTKYLELLEKRQCSLMKTAKLSKSNTERHQLLQNRHHDDINKALIIPPLAQF